MSSPVLFRCPTTGLMAQALIAEDVPRDADRQYRPVECIACRGIHLINPATGRLLSEESRGE